MQVRIDQSRQNHPVAQVMNQGVGRRLIGRNHAANLPIAHEDRSRVNPIRGHDPRETKSCPSMPEPIVPSPLFQLFRAGHSAGRKGLRISSPRLYLLSQLRLRNSP
jgi:hypothetical protein